MTDARRRFLLVALVGLLPWSVVVIGDFWTILHPLGLFNFTQRGQWSFVFVYDYLFTRTRGLPDYILAWPTGIVVYLAALGSAALGLIDAEDKRLTAGLLALVGLTQFSVGMGFNGRPRYTAVPIATITTLTLVWWVYWPDLKRAFLATE